MQWSELLGHHRQRAWFQTAIAQDRVGSGFLFVGPSGIGKHAFAVLLTKTMFCERVPPQEMNPCGECPSCQQVEARTHPDLLMVARPPKRSLISIEVIAGEPRNQNGLCFDLHLAPLQSTRRIAIIDDADTLSQDASNALLKTLEEPPAGAIIILVGTSAQKQLPTIRSRCQIVRFEPLELDDAQTVLTARGLGENATQVREVLELADGDLQEAARMLNPEATAFRGELTELLRRDPPSAHALVNLVSGYVGESGDEASVRRDRFRETSFTAIAHFRQVIRNAVQRGEEIERPMQQLERTLLGLQQIDRNVNVTALIEAWAIDLQNA